MPEQRVNILIYRPDGTLIAQYLLGDGEHLIGRDINCPVYLDSEYISNNHAKLHLSHDGIQIEDLNSTSGTFLDGVTVRGKLRIKPGQTLQVGDLTIDLQPESSDNVGPGSRLGDGRYTLIRMLGRGGMGEVWLAKDEQLEEEVALKKLPPEVGADAMALADMRREVQKSRILSHPNIIRIHDLYVKAGEDPLITLEYVDGTDLTAIAATKTNGIFNWTEIKPLVLQLCDALEYAHGQKIVHRDLKPANMMISRKSEVKLADFGIAATMADSLSRSSMQGFISGTTLYMSPQQMEGEAPQASDDIYAFGSTLYELLTSRPPFYTGDVQHQVQEVIPKPMEQRLAEFGFSNEIPDYVQKLVMSCLAKEPEGRPKSMEAIGQWIKSEGDDKNSIPKPTTKTVRRARTVREPLERELTPAKKRAKYAALAAAIAIVIGLGFWAKNQLEGLNTVQISGTPGSSPDDVNSSATQPTNSGSTGGATTVTPEPPPTIVVTPKPAPATPEPPVKPVTSPPKPNLPPPTVTAGTNAVSAAGGALVFKGHTNSVFSVAWSPDGKHLASGSQDQTVRVWEASGGKLVRTMEGHTNMVNGVAWSPNGKRLASVIGIMPFTDHGDKIVKVWEAVTGKLVHSLQEHTSAHHKLLGLVSREDGQLRMRAYNVAWSPDGKKLASASGDKTVRVWEASGDKLVHTLQGHADWVRSLAWSPDGKRLVSGGHDKTVRVWEVSGGELVRTMEGHASMVNSVVWSPDSQRLASGSADKTVKVWEAASGRELITLQGHTDVVDSVAWNPDGTKLASGSADKTVKIWEAASGRELITLQGHTKGVYSVAWSPDGTKLASGSQDTTVRVWDLPSQEVLQYTTLGNIRGIAIRNHVEADKHNYSSPIWSPDGSMLAMRGEKLWKNTGYSDFAHIIRIISATDGRTLRSFQFSESGSASGGVLVCTATVPAWNQDGTLLAYNYLDGTSKIEIRNIVTEEIVAQYSFEEHPPDGHLAWSPDGKKLASTSKDKNLRIIDAASGKELLSKMIMDGKGPAVWSPDSNQIACASIGNTIRIINATDGKLIHSLKSNPTSGTISQIAWSPNGARIFSSGLRPASNQSDPHTKIWNLSTGKELGIFSELHATSMFASSGDGRLLVAWGYQNRTIDPWTIAIGDAASGATLYKIKESKRAIYLTGEGLRAQGPAMSGLVWSPKGKRLFCLQNFISPIAGGGYSDAIYNQRFGIWEISSPFKKKSAEDIVPAPPISGPSVNQDMAVGVAGAKVTRAIGPLEKEIYSLSWSPDGTKLATGAGAVHVWDAAQGKELQFFMGDQAGSSKIVAWSPDGKTLAATSKGSDRVSIFDLQTEKKIKSHKAPSGAINYNLSWHPEGEILIGDGINKINPMNDSDQLYEQASGTALTGILTAVLSPAKDGAIAVGDTNGDINVLNIGTPNVLHISGHKRPVRSVAWSPDAKKLASVSDDRTLRIWDATTGKALHVLRGHVGFIKCVSWSRDGKRLASGSSMGEIVVWNATTGKVLHVIKEKSPIQCIAWSPDSTRLATGGAEKTVKLWEFPNR